MSTLPRYTLALVVALIVGFGFRTFNQLRGAKWIVSPQQIADAHAAGKPAYEQPRALWPRYQSEARWPTCCRSSGSWPAS